VKGVGKLGFRYRWRGRGLVQGHLQEWSRGTLLVSVEREPNRVWLRQKAQGCQRGLVKHPCVVMVRYRGGQSLAFERDVVVGSVVAAVVRIAGVVQVLAI
jgi:hypothetical protein